MLYLHISPKKILAIAYAFYFIGLFAQSWFGVLRLLDGTLVWSLLKLVKKVIVSTRDGLFVGFILTGMGMLFALYKIPLTKKQAGVGFLLSTLLMLAEALTLKHFHFINEHDTYFFLIPAVFFYLPAFNMSSCGIMTYI